MKNNYTLAIEDCIQNFLSLPALYDILLRGTASNIDNLTNDWSDIDLTIILNQISPQALININKVYVQLKKKYTFKVSITIVSKEDFFSPIHHHGIKSLNYNLILKNAYSIFKKQYPEWVSDREKLKNDCIYHTAYLIHELRSRYIKLKFDHFYELKEFALHLIRRTKHLIRHVIYIQKNFISEEIDKKHFEETFDIPGNVLSKFNSYKTNWQNLRSDNKILINTIFEVMSLAEKVYENNISFLSKTILTKSELYDQSRII